MKKNPILKVILIILSALACAGLSYYLHHKKMLESAFTYSSYYIIWFGIFYLFYLVYPKIVAVFDGVHTEGTAWHAPTKNMVVPIVAALALCLLVFLAIPCEYRVLADETNLLNVSQAFYQEHTATHPIDSFYYYNQLHYVTTDVPHRPLLWPFLASLIHTLVGYYPQNGFVLNFAVCFVSLITLIRMCSKQGNRTIGIMAAIILVSFPLYAINVTSSGYDPLNLMVILLVYAATFTFLQKEDARSLEILGVTLALAAQGRYETVVFGLPLGLVALFWLKKIKWQDLSCLSFLLPILFLPVVWQRILSPDVRNAGDIDAEGFGLKFLITHIKNAGQFLFTSGEPRYPNSVIILGLAFIGAILILVHVIKSKDRVIKKKAFIFGGVVLVSHALIAVIHLSYYLSDLRQPFISRLFVAHLGIIALCAAYTLYTLYSRQGLLRVMALFALVFLPLYHWTIAAADENSKSLVMYREFYFTRHFLQSQDAPNLLVITDRPSLYTALNYGGVNFDYANDHAGELKDNIKNSLFKDIFVIRHINLDDRKSEEVLSKDFKLQRVEAIQIDADQEVEISRMLGE